MAEWEKIKILNEHGDLVQAQAPVIISASRSTDIPAFYSDWLMERIEKGFVKWINPFNGVPLYVSLSKVRLFVFWSKNPKPMLGYLNTLDERGLHYYFQFTLNDYDAEKYEPAVPCVAERVNTFIQLSERLGKNRVIWRFDPLILTDKLSVKDLLKKVEGIGNQLAPYTSRMVFSFADIDIYGKVERNLAKAGIAVREFNAEEMEAFAQGLATLNQRWGLGLSTCAEKIDLAAYGIEHNRCIDDRIIRENFRQDADLMRFCGYDPTEQIDLFNTQPSTKKARSLKDKGQREACGCIKSKDIGEYNTCPHLCTYCYANASAKTALANYNRHKENIHSSSIRG